MPNEILWTDEKRALLILARNLSKLNSLCREGKIILTELEKAHEEYAKTVKG